MFSPETTAEGIYYYLLSSRYMSQYPVCLYVNFTNSLIVTNSQVTGTRCTKVEARQSWAEYSSRPTMDSRHQGWAIKDYSVLSEMHSICEQPFYGIILMILHINKSFKKSPMVWDTCMAFSLPDKHARHDTTELKLMINTRSLSNQASKSVHPSLAEGWNRHH